MRLLIIEDESLIADGIASTCTAEGFICQIAGNGTEGMELIQFYDYDAIILDLMLPDMSGYEVLKKTRLLKKTTPIIVLSGLSSTEEKIKYLSNGADDYITKPFSRAELLARACTVIRRTSGHATAVIEIGPLTLNLNNRVVTIYGNEVPLTCKEYAILELLALKKGSVVAKETFLNHMYGGMDDPDLKIVDVFICKLRKKIAEISGGINFIETVWGRGYLMKEVHNTWKNPTFTKLKVG